MRKFERGVAFNTNDSFGKEALNIRVEYSRWWLTQIPAPPTGPPTLSLFGRGEIIIFCRRAYVRACVRHDLHGRVGGWLA